MANLQLHVVNNIYDPGVTCDFYVLPTKLVYSNAVISKSSEWREYSNVTVSTATSTEPGSEYTYDHAWGVKVTPGSTKDSHWSGKLTSLIFTFSNAVFHPASNQFYDFQVQILDAYGFNADPASRDVILVSLSDTNTTNYSGFWIQSYLNKMPGTAYKGASGSATIRMYVLNHNTHTVASGTFLFPFSDLDVSYDAVIAYDDPSAAWTPDFTHRYAENITATAAGCRHIYGDDASWLNWYRFNVDQYGNEQFVGSGLVKDSNGQQHELPIRFTTSHKNEDDREGYKTGIVCQFNKVWGECDVVWRGSICGTSLLGEGLIHEVRYHANIPQNPPPGSVDPSTIPSTQYKRTGVPITLSTLEPKYNSSSSTGLSFLGWAISPTGDVKYSKGAPLNDDAVTDLYAKWQYTYNITFVSNGGYGINNSATPPIEGPNKSWTYAVSSGGSIKMCGSNSKGWRFERLGHEMKGWSTNPQSQLASYEADFTFSNITSPATYYAIYRQSQHTVRFRDGFREDGQDIIKQLTKDHGSSAESDAPIPSPEAIRYADGVNRVFQKGGFYRFKGWSGSLTNIRDNTDLVAIWEFVPIWQMKSGSWQKYQPVDNRENISNNSITIHQVPQYPQYGDPPHTNSPSIKMTLSGYVKQNADKSIDVTISQAYLNAGSYSDKFECDVFAWLVAFDDAITPSRLVTNTYGKTYLFSKPMSTTSWNDNQIKLTSPATLRIPYSAYSSCTTSTAIKLVVGLMSICTCAATATTDTPVAVLNVTGRPDIDPYFYRYQDNHSLIDPHKEWVCTRPFYICKTINNVKGWCSCEDQTKLIFGPNGEEL